MLVCRFSVLSFFRLISAFGSKNEKFQRIAVFCLEFIVSVRFIRD